MQNPAKHKRAAGTGSLVQRTDRAGRVTFYGQWRVDGRKVKRRLGRKRASDYPAGLTEREAAKALQKLMVETTAPPPTERVAMQQAGDHGISRVEMRGCKKSTVEGYRTILTTHLVPYFGERNLASITRRDVEAFIAAKRRAGIKAKTIRNYLAFLHQLFDLAVREGWTQQNVCKLIDLPRDPQEDAEIRFLTPEDIEALLRAVPDDRLGVVERVLYLAATQTGMRQGELIALRWQDVDWERQRVRVRRNYVRGEFGTPKSRRSTRSVPLTTRLAATLEGLFQRSAWQADDDLVFAHPLTGKPLDRSKVLKRFKDTLDAAKVRRVRFHDLRHSFATAMARAGVPMRTLQEYMGHRDIGTTLIYADYAPGAGEAELIEAAFAPAAAAVVA